MLEISTAKIYCFSETTKCLVEIYVFFYSFTLVWQINLSLLYNRIQSSFSFLNYGLSIHITTHEILLSLGYFRLSRGTDGGQNERKSANFEVENQKSAKIDEILNA